MADYDLTVTASGAGLDAILSKANTALQPADVGGSVQGYDAATAKLDIAQTWTTKQTFNLFEAAAGTLTADTPFVISQTWNNAAVAFTGIKVDITNMQSASGAKLFDVVFGGASVFNVRRTGITIEAGSDDGIALHNSYGGNQVIRARSAGGVGVHISALTIGGSILHSSSSVNSPAGGFYFGSNLIEQIGGTSPQAYRIYNTYTSATNYERAKFAWESNRFVIGTEAETGTKRGITLEASDLIFSSLPTTDPAVAGQLWLDGTALKVSAGV